MNLLHRQRPTGALAIAVLIAAGAAWASAFWIDTLIMMAIFSLFALSAGISYGQAGVPSMATGTFAAVGAYGTAILSTRFGLSPFVGLLFAIAVPALLAYPLARTVTRLSPLPLSLATFALAGVAEITIRAGGELTGGFVGIVGIPPLAIAPTPHEMLIAAWLVVLVVVFFCINIIASPYGRALNTARNDALRATADGANVSRLLAGFISLSASIAGLGGWLYAHYISYLSPESLNSYLAISALLMAVVGGAQTILGPIFGASVLLLLNNFLPAAQTQGMVYGAVLVGALLIAPQGVFGLVRRFAARPSHPAEADGGGSANASAATDLAQPAAGVRSAS